LTQRPGLGVVPGIVFGVVAALAGCSSGPPPVDPSSPEARAAALAARAEDDAAAGRLRDALDAYRDAASVAPGEARYRERVVELRASYVTTLHAEAESALERVDLAMARRAALALVEVAPESPAGYHVLASAAEAEGMLEDAWAAAQKAHARAPADAALTESLAALALRTSRFAEAEALYGALAKGDPSLREKQTAARLEFQVQNLPAAARKAVAAPRITRAQFAALLFMLVPEVASARVPQGGDVAVDVVDRPERAPLVKAIALGFFSVARGTHLVGADTPVFRSEMPGHLRRLAALLGTRDEACFLEPSSLATCGILPETTSRQVSGREAFAAIDATLGLSR
jgi:tetratricopeptide (TPR) repeat protein